MTESNDINVGDEYINDYGAKITILEPTKDGEYQFKVTNTKTGVEGDVLATRSMKHVLDMNGYKKVENKLNESSDRYQLRKFPSEQEYKGEWGAYDTKEDKFVQKGSRYVMKAAIIDLNRKDSKTESKINDIIANRGILNEIKTFNDKTIRDSFLNMCELEQISIRNQIQVLQECRRLIGKEPLTESEDKEYTNRNIRTAIKKVLDKDHNIFTDDSIYDVVEVLTGISDIDKMPKELLNRIRNIVEKDRYRKVKKEDKNDRKEFNYMLLDRLRDDCEYFLNYGNGYEPNLWAGDIDSQISKMKKLYNSFADDEKPEWITIEDINNYEKKMKELKTNKQKKTESTPEKRISKYKESDGSVLRGGWKEISDKEAEELAKQASIDDPTDVYYVEYNDIMDSSSDIRWYKGKSYTVDEIIEIRKKEKYALYKKMMQAELEEQCENERRKGRPSIKNQSKTESFKITDPRDKRRKLIVPDKIENVLKSSKFEEIKSAIKKHDGIISNPRIYVNDNKLGLNYSFTGFNDEEHMKVFSDLGFNDLDTISNGQLNGWGYSQYEAPINIEGITVILSYSPGVRIISIEFDYPLKEDTADNEPFYRYDNQENFEKAKREYQRNPNEETLKAFKDARSAFEKEINAKKE